MDSSPPLPFVSSSESSSTPTPSTASSSQSSTAPSFASAITATSSSTANQCDTSILSHSSPSDQPNSTSPPQSGTSQNDTRSSATPHPEEASASTSAQSEGASASTSAQSEGASASTSAQSEGASASTSAQSEEAKKDEIGPYSTAAGLSRKDFKGEIDLSALPHIGLIKNGLVLELLIFLNKTLNLTVTYVANVVIALHDTPSDECTVPSIVAYINHLHSKSKQIKRNKKEGKLVELREGVFHFVRSKRKSKEEDTPRKKRLRRDLNQQKEQTRKVTKRLVMSEKKVGQLENSLSVSEGLSERLEEERSKRVEAEERVVEAEERMVEAQEEVKIAEQDKQELEEQVAELQQELEGVMQHLQTTKAKFNPLEDDLAHYKKSYEDRSKEFEKLTKKYNVASSKLSAKSNLTRNLNKVRRRRDEKIKTLEDNTDIVSNLKADLEEAKAKLSQTTFTCHQLQTAIDQTRKERASLVKKVWYRDQKLQKLSQRSHSEDDILFYENRTKFLEQRVHELEDCIALCENQDVTTFQDGRYTNNVRELIMELLSLNVSMSAVNQVIRSTLKKMANIELGRLPSKATTSQLVTEARVLADLEVGYAMRAATPEAALGNVVHGDGTTKFHKKYQNYQVTLADSTSRTTGLMEMGHANTEAVVESYHTRMMEIAEALETVEKGEDKQEIFKELVTSVTATMTDQGPTMPQFSDAIAAIREELLPSVVKNWADMPPDVQSVVGQFGTFYCKMHPIINFAEEVNRTLKSYEDIATSGKNAHTLLTAEAGATRLVRTASKAFHHRGSDKSGVEDEFTEFVEREYGVPNRLAYYVGNRANILFEGAAGTYFHLKHMSTFVKSLPTPNALLLAVCEDSEEKLHVAELKALGIVHFLITKPLWDAIKSAENVLSLNATLNKVQLKLEKWKDDPQGLIDGESAVPEMHIQHGEVYDSVMAPAEDPDVHGMCIQALQLICCAILLILERQCQDQLPGGKYWDTTEATKAKFANVPSTNVIGERDFALLDMMVRRRPNARTITLEALIMWTNNGTVKWLDGLSIEDKTKYMDAARRHADTAIRHYEERKKQIKKERWEKLREKQQKRDDKEKKDINTRLTLTQEIVRQGGVWGADDIEEKYKSLCEGLTNEQVRREIHKQLAFHQKILKSKAPQRDHFQLTATIGGKPKKFTKEEMKDHLLAVVELNDIQTSADPNLLIPAEQPEPSVTYTEEEQRADAFERKKIQIAKKLDEERKKRAVKSSREHLSTLEESPHLLVGKEVQHRCFTPGPERIALWYKGKVTGIEEGSIDGLNTEFIIEYDQSALAEDEPMTEIFPLLADLKKNDLIICGKL